MVSELRKPNEADRTRAGKERDDPGSLTGAQVRADTHWASSHIRAEAERGASQIRAEAHSAAATLRAVAEHEQASIELESSERRDRIAAVEADLASVHAQLGQINAGIIALQTHSLRQTGGVALALSVLIVIAWKVIGG